MQFVKSMLEIHLKFKCGSFCIQISCLFPDIMWAVLWEDCIAILGLWISTYFPLALQEGIKRGRIGMEGEEKEEEFLLVFLIIYSTAELHAQAYTFLS